MKLLRSKKILNFKWKIIFIFTNALLKMKEILRKSYKNLSKNLKNNKYIANHFIQNN